MKKIVPQAEFVLKKCALKQGSAALERPHATAEAAWRGEGEGAEAGNLPSTSPRVQQDRPANRSPREFCCRAASPPLLSSIPRSSPPSPPRAALPGTWLEGRSLSMDMVAPGMRGSHQSGRLPRALFRINRALACAASLVESSGCTASKGFAVSHFRPKSVRRHARGEARVVLQSRIKPQCRRCAAGRWDDIPLLSYGNPS